MYSVPSRRKLARGPTDELIQAFATAALAHHAGFGHSLIFTVKTAELIERLGDDVAEPLLCLFVCAISCARTAKICCPSFVCMSSNSRIGANPALHHLRPPDQDAE